MFKCADLQPKLTHDIAINNYKGALTNDPGVYAICDCDQSHRNIVPELCKGAGPIITMTTIAEPNKLMNDIGYILRSRNNAFSLTLSIFCKNHTASALCYKVEE